MFAQGLFLVLVPVCFQIIFVIVLSAKLQEAERDVLKENHAKMLIATSQNLLSKFYQSGSFLHLYWRFQDESFIEQYKESISAIKQELRSLKRSADNPEERRAVDELAKNANTALESMNHYLKVAQSGGRARDIGPEMQESLSNFFVETNHFVKVQKSQTARAPVERASSRQAVVMLLYLGSFLNVLIGIGLVFFFARGTVSRLQTLVENTRRLQRNDSLLQPVPGSDEIAQLDLVFHEMAQSLTEAARHKQELLQMVGHDLKTPLSSVQMTLSSLAEGTYGQLPEAAFKRVKMTEYNTTRLMHLIRDLLDIERLESGKLEMNQSEEAVRDFIAESIQAVQAYAENKQIQIECSHTDARVVADKARIIQVMVNLLANAIKFSPRQSTVKISVEESIANTEIRISDCGRGIPPGKLSSIFNRFEQVQKEDSTTDHGTGLGLAIVRAIVEAHQGEIGVSSTEGEGSTFWFRLPVMPGPVTVEPSDG